MDKSFSGRSKTELIKYAPEVSVVKKSELLQIIREELEVVLTNEEAVELFDLDPAALLDEFVDESVGKDSRVPKTPKDATKAEKKAANKRARKAAKKKKREGGTGWQGKV